MWEAFPAADATASDPATPHQHFCGCSKSQVSVHWLPLLSSVSPCMPQRRAQLKRHTCALDPLQRVARRVLADCVAAAVEVAAEDVARPVSAAAEVPLALAAACGVRSSGLHHTWSWAGGFAVTVKKHRWCATLPATTASPASSAAASLRMLTRFPRASPGQPSGRQHAQPLLPQMNEHLSAIPHMQSHVMMLRGNE